MTSVRNILIFVAALLSWVGGGLADDYAELIWQQESGGGDYAALNTNGGTAAGAYQITAGTLANLGYVKHTGGSRGSWSNYAWTSQATSQGVSSLSGFLNSPAGHALQDEAFQTLTARNWSGLSSQALGLAGQKIQGVSFTENGLLTAAHFLGIGPFNDWVASGFDPTVFPQSYLDANGFSTHAELQAYLMNRIGQASGTTFAGGPGGFGMSGAFDQTDGFPGFGAKRPILIREIPPFQGERTTLGGTQ